MPDRTSQESSPLITHFRPVISYGSVFSYYNFLRKAPDKTLHRTESMVSICYKALSSYIIEDDPQGLQNFLDSKRVNIDDKDDNGATALHLAATRGKINFVRILLNFNAEVNSEDHDNWTPLLCATKEGHYDVVQELLERDANKEHRDMGGWTALMWASYKGHANIAFLLLEKGADVNAHGNFHISSLLWASGRGHASIAKALLEHGAKPNIGDKYGTSALVWASRKGDIEIVDALIKAGANVDCAGMHSWTPLLVATMGNHVDVVNLLLECKPNINALDKDGCTALTLACKDGYMEIATALVNAGAYINIQDRGGDTNLIHAVKGGHRAIIDLLLKKYVDVDIPGKERKTATYTAVEKGNIPILKMLLTSNPDLEIATKDGDTPLLKAVRSRNAEAVSLLLDRKAKVSASDKWGDTALHIAMRARSKAIVEILLRNPKNSQLLYRPNRSGETPYNIDLNHTKTILGQIFGARRLNTNEDNENLLGYDLYSSALADMLSEPSLSMPITVGLFAKWGSGKSFLLSKLREEMKNFARQWLEPVVHFSWILFTALVHLSLVIGLVIGLLFWSWAAGIIAAVVLVILNYAGLISLWYSSHRYNWDFPYNLSVSLTKKMTKIKVVLQVIFCHPPGSQFNDSVTAHPIRFYFTEQTRVGTTAAGENCVVQMIGSLYDAIETDYGTLSTRLYRAFRPKPISSASSWRWRRLCCVPMFLLFEVCLVCILISCGVLAVYLMEMHNDDENVSLERMTVPLILAICGGFVLVAVIANAYTIGQMIKSLVYSQRKRLQKAISNLHTVKSEGFLQTLKKEVTLMTEMVKCLDAFTQQQTRLVVIVDGLDSCEQDKVLLILDSVHTLFSEPNSPFIIILAIDPHVIAKAVEANSRKHLMNETNIGGHDYLHNMVHLPFFLQNSGLRKVKSAQKSSYKKSQVGFEAGSSTELSLPTGPSRRSSSDVLAGTGGEKLKIPGKRSSRKLKMSESIASSLGSNLNRAGGPHDLTKMLLTDDYFSDVNPRSMRRLMNVVYITGRLLKAFQIDFNWYHLASWINITEQWPYRTTWIIYYHDTTEEMIDDSMPLKLLYDKVKHQIPTSKEIEPLVALDRDDKKLDVILTFHRSTLLVSDLRVFLPFTINLDPYIKKVIKDGKQEMEESMNFMAQPQNLWGNSVKSTGVRRPRPSSHQDTPYSSRVVMPPQWPHSDWISSPSPQSRPSTSLSLPSQLSDVQLGSLKVAGVSSLISKIPDLDESHVTDYIKAVQENNINGKVLLHCDLSELKKVLGMTFGDWEMFRMIITLLRDKEAMFEVNPPQRRSSTTKPPVQAQPGNSSRSDPPQRDNKGSGKSNSVEKQVTLEEQMICGALQTLNEEACEDVLEEKGELLQDSSGDLMSFPPMKRTLSQNSCYSCGPEETDVILLQNIPLQSWCVVPEEQSVCSSGANTPLIGRRDVGELEYMVGGFGSGDLLRPCSRPTSLYVLPEKPAKLSISTEPDHVRAQIRGGDDETEDDESTPLVSASPSLTSPLGTTPIAIQPPIIISAPSSSESIRHSPSLIRQPSFDLDPETTV